MIDDFQQEETRVMIRTAVEAHPDVVRCAPGPRHNEFRIDFKDGSFRVVAIAVRDSI